MPSGWSGRTSRRHWGRSSAPGRASAGSPGPTPPSPPPWTPPPPSYRASFRPPATASAPSASASRPWRTPTSTSLALPWPTVRPRDERRRCLRGPPPAGRPRRPPVALPALLLDAVPPDAAGDPGHRRVRGAGPDPRPRRRLRVVPRPRDDRNDRPLLLHLLLRVLLPGPRLRTAAGAAGLTARAAGDPAGEGAGGRDHRRRAGAGRAGRRGGGA